MVNRDFVDGYLSQPSEFPTKGGDRAIDSPFDRLRVTGGRGSAFYLAHSYHTKVPPEAVLPFIEHYTKPGDVVLDPFCGSGMVGVAASMLGRRTILNDLSPAAVHLSWNHTHPCEPTALRQGFARLEARVAAAFTRLYGTTDSRGRAAVIQWTMWSTRHRCPACAGSFLLWDVMDRETGRLGSKIACPRCQTELRRGALDNLGSEPAWIAYETADGKRGEKAPSSADIEHAMSFRRDQIKEWFPSMPLNRDSEMYIRCALQLQNIDTIADFYTTRNLHALAMLWAAIQAEKDDRVCRALAFAFTNTAWHGTRMRRFNARGGQRPLTGTLYIPQLSSEANVLEVLRNKIAQLERYYTAFTPPGPTPPAISLGSALELGRVADASVDYIFTDPPFGSNIFYADCNLIWESWLGRLTNSTDEAVVNKSLSSDRGGKSLDDYGRLIGGAMKEMARVLKPSGWATVVFHNTDAKVWEAIHQAAASAGFTFHEASSLDRQQQSHKGYKGRSGTEDVAHFDVVLNLQKRSIAPLATTKARPPIDIEPLVRRLMADPAIVSRGVQGLHAEIMRQAASDLGAPFVDYADIRMLWDRFSVEHSSAA